MSRWRNGGVTAVLLVLLLPSTACGPRNGRIKSHAATTGQVRRNCTTLGVPDGCTTTPPAIPICADTASAQCVVVGTPGVCQYGISSAPNCWCIQGQQLPNNETCCTNTSTTNPEGIVCNNGQQCLLDPGGHPVCCDAGATLCGSTCVHENSDNNNCGACGRVCASPKTCVNGACTCPSNTTTCNGNCVDTSTDNNNCGGCDNICSSPRSCSKGQCNCSTGLTLCNGRCVDTNSDPSNCGGCGRPCNLSCTSGVCACSGGTTDCGNGCVDTSSDSNNCGSCGNACGNTQTCSGGTCNCTNGGAPCGQGCCTGSAVCTQYGCEDQCTADHDNCYAQCQQQGGSSSCFCECDYNLSCCQSPQACGPDQCQQFAAARDKALGNYRAWKKTHKKKPERPATPSAPKSKTSPTTRPKP